MLKKVLVVDDSPLIHQMYRIVMSRYKCELLSAKNGQEALEVLAGQDEVELVLLDMNMPVMNGVQFLEECSRQGLSSRIPIIVVSTEGKEADAVAGLKLGASGYLTKPFSAAQLHEIITRTLASFAAKSSRACPTVQGQEQR
jgi:two-component system, chemotaxis family, chemotaxis protein CheY